MVLNKDEMLRRSKLVNEINASIREAYAPLNAAPPAPELLSPDLPYVETMQFEDKMNNIHEELQTLSEVRTAIQDINERLEVEKQARMQSENNSRIQQEIESNRYKQTLFWSRLATVAAFLAAFAALIPLFR